MKEILAAVAGAIVALIEKTSYPGIFFLMTIESVGIPAPSEIIMPFSGYLVEKGRFDFWLTVLMGTLGNLLGSLIAYAIAFWGGRPLLFRYGRFVLLHPTDLERAERWFGRFGVWAVFLARLLPVIRTYIAFPAGLAKMPLLPFLLATGLGSLPWVIFLTELGRRAGVNWAKLQPFFERFDFAIALFIVLAIVFWLGRHLVTRRAGRI